MVEEPWITEDQVKAVLSESNYDVEEARKAAERYLNPPRASTPASPEASEPASKEARKSKYPWDLWMDGEYHEVIRGEDFEMPIPKFQTLLHRKAGDKDLKVKSETVKGTTKQTCGFMYGVSYEAIRKRWDALGDVGLDDDPIPPDLRVDGRKTRGQWEEVEDS